MLYPLTGIKNGSLVGEGFHFRLPFISTPQYFNVKPSPEMRRGLTLRFSSVPILPNQLLAQAS